MLDIFGHWTAQKEHKIPHDYTPSEFISVIVPARNEAENIVQCLQSILKNKYPPDLFEILVIDDHSNDDTADLVQSLNSSKIQLLRLIDASVTGKKQAIEYGIANSKGDTILITDADCVVGELWMSYHSSFYELNKAKCVTGPIKYHKPNRLIEQFQSLDLTGMLGVTQAGIFSDKWYMANGANMSFKKKQFFEVGAYNSSKQFASGDDVFLIQAIADIYSEDVHFLKNSEAAVSTQAEQSWKSLYQQRVRWGTKNRSYKKKAITLTLGLVFIFSCSILLNLTLIPVFGLAAIFVFVIQLVSKLLIDYFYLHSLNKYFYPAERLKAFFPSSIIYIFYIVWIGLASLFIKSYIWKDRRVS